MGCRHCLPRDWIFGTRFFFLPDALLALYQPDSALKNRIDFQERDIQTACLQN
jgi:hypothetical protein